MDDNGEVLHRLSKEDRSENVYKMNRKENFNCTKVSNSVNEYDKCAILTPNLNKNNSKTQNYKNQREMVSLLPSHFKRNNFTLENNDDLISILTPRFNRNNSRFKYVIDADETDTLFTPNLKRSTSRTKHFNSLLTSYDYNIKAVNINHKLNHDNYEKELLLSPKVERTTVERQYRKNGYYGEADMNLNLDLNDNSKNINNSTVNIDVSVDLFNLKYDEGLDNRRNFVNNSHLQANTCVKNIPREEITETKEILYKILNKDNMIKSNLQTKRDIKEFDISKDYPLLACRVRKGRPYWDRVFGYWVHLYPRYVSMLYNMFSKI